MRVWLDDERKMPEGYDVWVTSAHWAKKLIDEGEVTFISLDHDLGDDLGSGSGYDVACHIEMLVSHGQIKMPLWECHSQNPSGRKRIIEAMRSAERRSKINEENL